MPDVTGLTVSTAVQTLNRKSISSSSIEYHDYNTGAKLDKDKVPSSTEVLYQDPQAGTSVDGTVILYVSVATASSTYSQAQAVRHIRHRRAQVLKAQALVLKHRQRLLTQTNNSF